LLALGLVAGPVDGSDAVLMERPLANVPMMVKTVAARACRCETDGREAALPVVARCSSERRWMAFERPCPASVSSQSGPRLLEQSGCSHDLQR
jgi:hypothetical protein